MMEYLNVVAIIVAGLKGISVKFAPVSTGE